MADFPHVLLGAAGNPTLQGIHADEDVRPSLVLLLQPGLEGRARNRFRWQNPLHGLLAAAVADQDSDTVIRLMQGEDVLGSGKKSRSEYAEITHEDSFLAT